MFRSSVFRALPRSSALLSSAALLVADEPPTTLDRVTVFGRGIDLVGEATAASDGQVGAGELAARPFLRRGELLEVVPGGVITQHSGSGKANQYFLRGFNLDHGTDFAVSVDGLPMNLRTPPTPTSRISTPRVSPANPPTASMTFIFTPPNPAPCASA